MARTRAPQAVGRCRVRRSHSSNHFLVDSVRGGTKYLASESADAETNDNTVTKSLDADGFTLGSYDGINGDGKTFVAWNWKGAGSNQTLTAGDNDTVVNANPTAGFSIVTWTGTGSTPASMSQIGADIYLCQKDYYRQPNSYHYF